MQQINFNKNLTKGQSVRMCLIIEKAKEKILDFSKETGQVLWFYFVLM